MGIWCYINSQIFRNEFLFSKYLIPYRSYNYYCREMAYRAQIIDWQSPNNIGPWAKIGSEHIHSGWKATLNGTHLGLQTKGCITKNSVKAFPNGLYLGTQPKGPRHLGSDHKSHRIHPTWSAFTRLTMLT